MNYKKDIISYASYTYYEKLWMYSTLHKYMKINKFGPLIMWSAGSGVACKHTWQKMDNEIPFGFILFYSAFDYSQACTFCSDFDIDVLEIFVNGYCCLTFFSSPEFHACRAFCDSSGFQNFNLHEGELKWNFLKSLMCFGVLISYRNYRYVQDMFCFVYEAAS